VQTREPRIHAFGGDGGDLRRTGGQARADRKGHLIDVGSEKLFERERCDLPQARLAGSG
jgi:hypothetical protein